MLISAANAQIVDQPVDHIAHVKEKFPAFDISHFASQLFWLILCFACFYWIMARFIIPRFSAIIETRRDRIATDIAIAARLKQETDEAIAVYKRKLEDAQHKAATVMRDAEALIRKKADAIKQENEAALHKRLIEAEHRIADVRDKAMENVGGIAQDVVRTIVEDVIGARTSENKIAKAVNSVVTTKGLQ